MSNSYRIRVLNYGGSQELFEYLSIVVPRVDDILTYRGKDMKVSAVKFCIEYNERFSDCRDAVLNVIELN